MFAIVFGLGFSKAQAAPAGQENNPCTLDSQTKNAIDFIMYLRSQPHDDDSCTMTVEDGQLVVAPSITNPAMSFFITWPVIYASKEDPLKSGSLR